MIPDVLQNDALEMASVLKSTKCIQRQSVISYGKLAELLTALRTSGELPVETKEVPLFEIRDDLSQFLREVEMQEIIITRHGKLAGVLIGFESKDDWFECHLEYDPRFLHRIERARNSLIKLEDLESELWVRARSRPKSTRYRPTCPVAA
jgi:prevent-host-death family protein